MTGNYVYFIYTEYTIFSIAVFIKEYVTNSHIIDTTAQ